MSFSKYRFSICLKVFCGKSLDILSIFVANFLTGRLKKLNTSTYL